MATRISKALRAVNSREVQKASRGALTDYVVGVDPSYGQPRPTSADVNGLISPERLREIVMKGPTAGACLNAIIDFCTGVPIKVRNVDPAKPAPAARAELAKSFMLRPNPNDTWLQLISQTLRDLVTLGWAAVEIEKDAEGHAANLWPLDAARLYVDFDAHGLITGFDMLDPHGFPIVGRDGKHAWTPEELIYFRLNPQTNSRYPASRMTQVFPSAVIENLMLAFIGSRFTDSNVPFGVMDLGDITPEEQKLAIAAWNTQAKKAHRIVITGSRGGSKWTPFGYALKELEAKELLNSIRGYQMAILGVTMNELGESQDINKSNGYNLSFTFKKRAVEPVLNELCATLTKAFLVEGLGFTDLEFYYDEIDSRDELVSGQIDEGYQKTGVMTINQIRNRRGDPSIAGGDEPMVFTGSAWLPVRDLEAFSQAQLAALHAAVAAEQAAASQGTGTGPISPPLLRAAGSPEKFTTPDGAGSSTVKVRLPKSTPKSDTPQAPRGKVQAARSQGLRNEDL